MKHCKVKGDGNSCSHQIESIKRIISKMPNENIIQEQSDIIKSMGDPTRLKIIYLLKYGELCVCEIMDVLDKPQPTVSHHMNILKNSGLLKWRKQGVWTYYKLSNPEIADNLKNLLDIH